MIILLIIILTILLLFLAFSAFLGKINWSSVLTYYLYYLYFLLFIFIISYPLNFLIKLNLPNLETSFISFIIAITSTPFLIVLSNLYNKQRDINQLIDERKRDDYKYLQRSIKEYLDFIYEFKAKLEVIRIANFDPDNMKILISYYEKLLKGIFKYKLISEDQLDKYLLKNFCSPNNNILNLNMTNDIDKLLELISQEINTVLKDAEEEAQKQNYDNAIQKINKVINDIK